MSLSDNIRPGSLERYGKHYSQSGLMVKLSKAASRVGSRLVYMALLLYHTMLSDSVPLSVKGVIAGALGYLILPLDLLPDFIPVAGYTDDMAAMLAVLREVRASLTPEIRSAAAAGTVRLFPDFRADGQEESGF